MDARIGRVRMLHNSTEKGLAMSGLHGNGTEKNLGAPTGGARRRPAVWLIVFAVVVLAIGGTAVWATTSSSNSSTDAASTSTSSTSTSSSSATSTPSQPTATSGDASASDAASDGGTGGDVRATSDPHPFDAPAEVTSGVSATIGALTAVTGVASGVGESGGPAVRFEATITNDTDAAIDLQNVRMLVDFGPDSSPASELTGGPDIVAFPATLEPGASATAAYVFAIPAESRSDVRITVDYLASVPFALFAGAAPAS